MSQDGAAEAKADANDESDDQETPTCERGVRRTLTLTKAVSAYKVRYGVHSIQNERPEMEDAHCARLGLGESKSTSGTADVPAVELTPPASPAGEESSMGALSYFAVFDGHGGARAAEFSSEKLAELLASDKAALISEPTEALRRAFAKTEEEWHELGLKHEYMDGTTAAVVLVDRTANRAVVGNCGDSEVVLGTRDTSGNLSFKLLTEVHHLKRSQAEQDRITQIGGRLWRGRLGHPKINPLVCSLAVSRSIGDIYFKAEQYTSGKPSGLIADPFITSEPICGEDVEEQFLLIGCDGLWDTVTYQQASDFVFERLKQGDNEQAICEALVGLARDAGSSDNITVVVVVLVL